MRFILLTFAALSFLSAAKAQTPVEFLCKDFSFRMAVGGVVSYNGSTSTHQQMSLATSTGGVRNVTAPVMITVDQQFQAIDHPAGARGENLLSGQCGLADRAIPGISLDARSSLPILSFAGFSTVSLQSGQKYAGSTTTTASVALAPCPSHVRVFRAIPQNVNSYYVSGESSTHCL
jgi:hypothetical protein